MKKLIVANWKCQPITWPEAKCLFNSVAKGIKNVKNVEVVICPPFVYLSHFSLRGKPSRRSIRLGAQDIFWEDPPTGGGAFTGEISPAMLKDLGCEYVIIGHSERRKYLKETDETINKKLKAALKAGLKVILCIENIAQLGKDLKEIKNWKLEIENLIIAYEPIFAIGTGKPCGVAQAKKMRITIGKKLNKNIPILYGGSVNSQNAADYIEKGGFQGLLIGGVSLISKEFLNVVKSVDSL